MRKLLLVAGFAATLPVLAQVPEKRWNIDLHTFNPTLTGYYHDMDVAKGDNFDIEADLGLGKDGIKPGIAIEYQGPRFGIQLSIDQQDYAGDKILQRPETTLDGVHFLAGERLKSSVTLKAYELNWTIRCFRWDNAWIGVDLGTQIWDLQVDGNNVAAVNEIPYKAASIKVPMPIPQVGVSGGGKLMNDKIVLRAAYHLLAYKGAKCNRFLADARYFPLPWLGVRAFLDSQSFDIPKDSIKDDVEGKLDRKGAGFGVVFRF